MVFDYGKQVYTTVVLLLLCCRRALLFLSAPVILMMKQLPSDTPETMQQRAFAVCCTHCICLGCIPTLIGLPFLRFYVVVSSLFLLFVFSIFLPIATMSFAGYFLVPSLLSAFPAYLRTFFRVDLVRFRLSCDHGWIRSRSVNVR